MTIAVVSQPDIRLGVPLDPNTRDRIAAGFGAIAAAAGKTIMEFYASAIDVGIKPDGSPVSAADTAAEHVIREELGRLFPGIPVVAEESFDAGSVGPAELFVLVDPLDGTREFVSRNGEFTVNIALVERGRPVAGCVYAPAFGRMYLGGGRALRADVSPGEPLPVTERMKVLTTQSYPAAGLRAAVSRSHLDAGTDAMLDRLPIASRMSVGSALKFCVIAQGDADIYPRLAPTMEWDTAAGDAVLTAAGGCVTAIDGTPLRYCKTSAGFRNDAFVAWGRSPVLR